MISIITVSTVSTVTTADITDSVALIGVLILFGLLIQKEVTSISSNRQLHRLGQVLNIAIIPLVIAFLLIFISPTIHFLR